MGASGWSVLAGLRLTHSPAWLQRTLLLLDPPAKTKVSAMAGGAEESGFLKPGDRIRVSAGFLGEKVSRIAD